MGIEASCMGELIPKNGTSVNLTAGGSELLWRTEIL